MSGVILFSSPLCRELIAPYGENNYYSSENAANAVSSAMGACIAGRASVAAISTAELSEAGACIKSAFSSGTYGGLVLAVCSHEGMTPAISDFFSEICLSVLTPSKNDDLKSYFVSALEISGKSLSPVVIVVKDTFPDFSEITGFEPKKYRKNPERFVIEPLNYKNLADEVRIRLTNTDNEIKEKSLSATVLSGEISYDTKFIQEEMCVGCPYRGVFFALSKLWLRAVSDSGCTALGSKAPLLANDIAQNIGSSPAVLRGFLLGLGEKERKNTVGLIDIAGLKSGGLTGLFELSSDNLPATFIILDNGTFRFDYLPELEKLSHERLSFAEPFDVDNLELELKSALISPGLSIIVCKRDCVKLGTLPKDRVFTIDKNRCKGCKACGRLGCPAILPERRPSILLDVCVGCSLCQSVCKCSAVLS